MTTDEQMAGMLGDAALRTLRVRESVRATPRSRILRLELVGAPFAFRPGQAVRVAPHGRPRRPYSIACAPEEVAERQSLELLIRGGEELPGDADPMAPGSLVDVEGPFGAFVFPERVDETRVLFVAGGAGIAPLRAMLHHALRARPALAIDLVYSARTPDEFAYREELTGLAHAGHVRVTETVTRTVDGDRWTGRRGRIDRHLLGSAIASPDTLCFICGPQSLVHEVPGWLRELGVAAERIRVEQW